MCSGMDRNECWVWPLESSSTSFRQGDEVDAGVAALSSRSRFSEELPHVVALVGCHRGCRLDSDRAVTHLGSSLILHEVDTGLAALGSSPLPGSRLLSSSCSLQSPSRERSCSSMTELAMCPRSRRASIACSLHGRRGNTRFPLMEAHPPSSQGRRSLLNLDPDGP